MLLQLDNPMKMDANVTALMWSVFHGNLADVLKKINVEKVIHNSPVASNWPWLLLSAHTQCHTITYDIIFAMKRIMNTYTG